MKITKFLSVACMVALLTSCGEQAQEEKHTSFKTMVVEKSDITVPLKYSARVKGSLDVVVTPQISGQLMQKHVSSGQQVKAGQVLFSIDDRQARLALDNAEANLTAALAMEKSAQLEYESNKNLFEKKIVSSYMLNTAENAYNQAKATVAQARSAVNSAKVNLGFCTITAPVDGVIGSVPVALGVQVNPATELTTISGNAKMNAEFSVTENEVAAVMQSMDDSKLTNYIKQLPEVSLVLKNGTTYEHPGRIAFVGGMIDRNTGSLSCTASFPNPDGKLISGTQGTVVLPYSVQDVIVVPQNAVVRLLDKSLVYKVEKDGIANSVIITAINSGNGKDMVITSGLKPGDKIVTEGANNVHEGQKVVY